MLHGFDRMRFRDTLRWLAYAQGRLSFLCRRGVLLKDFQAYAKEVTELVRPASEQMAKAHDRPLIYLDSLEVSKE